MLNRQMRREMRRRGATANQIATSSISDFLQEAKNKEAEKLALGLSVQQHLWSNTPWTERELTSMRLTLYASFDALVKGHGDWREFDGLGMAINVATVRACEIDPTGLLASKLEPAIDGFARMKQRHATHGKLLFDGQGLEAARVAIDIYDQILELSTPKQMQLALKQAMQIVMEMTAKQTH